MYFQSDKIQIYIWDCDSSGIAAIPAVSKSHIYIFLMKLYCELWHFEHFAIKTSKLVKLLIHQGIHRNHLILEQWPTKDKKIN